MKVIFMGTPEFSVPALDALLEAGHEIVAVYCQPPRPAGRGKKDRKTPVHARAEFHGLPVRFPETLRSADAQREFADLQADVAVVVAYGLILPKEILDAPENGCVNIHASLLPRWRGAAPIHRAIMAGDAETGVCVMQMETGLDTGPVLLSRSCRIGAEETTGQLHDRLSQLGASLIIEALAKLQELVPYPQSEHGVTYAEKISKAEAKIDWTLSAEEVDRQIRGLSPFPGAWTVHDGRRVKCLASRVADGQGVAGIVLDDILTIACGTGAVQLTRLQREGKAAQDARDFLRGVNVVPGDRFGEK